MQPHFKTRYTGLTKPGVFKTSNSLTIGSPLSVHTIHYKVMFRSPESNPLPLVRVDGELAIFVNVVQATKTIVRKIMLIYLDHCSL